MTERDEAGLRRLKQELDEADWPAPELLARYATEPNRLTELEKQTVEHAIAVSPLIADELATLRGFDFARLDADRLEARANAGRQTEGAGTTGLARQLLAWLARPPAWIAAAALVALTVWLAQSDRLSTPTTPAAPTPQLAEREPPVPATRLPIGSDTGEEIGMTGPAGTPNAMPKPNALPEPNAKPEPNAPVDPSRIASREPSGSTEAAPDGAPNATTKPAPTGSGAGKQEILLAMAMPDYHPAYGVERAGGGEWIVRGAEDGPVHVVAVAPDHVTRACSAQPPLHWSLDRVPEAGDFMLTILDDRDEPVVLDRKLARPTRTGLQRLDLAALGIRLPSNRTLRWSVALREDEAAPPLAFDFGWLRVEPPDAATAAALAARGEDTQAAGYAELGCYAEALESALEARAAHPGDPAPQQAVAKLVEQAGLAATIVGN